MTEADTAGAEPGHAVGNSAVGNTVAGKTANPVYVAGPLFDEGERWWIEQVEATIASTGRPTFLPHRDNPPKTAANVADIFANNKRAIDDADIVVASLNGVTTDDGTAWEVGYAFALDKRIIGIHTDWRARFTDEIVNLMIEESLDIMTRSLDELKNVLSGGDAE